MASLPSPTWSDYRDAVDRFVTAIDGVLERGRARERQYEVFLVRAGLTAGSGASQLKQASIPPGQRHVLQRLIELTAHAHASLGGPRHSRPATVPMPAAARFFASRNRI